MTGPGVLIDLGDSAGSQPQVPPRRHRWSHRNWPLVSVGLVALAAATLTASRSPPQFVEVATLTVAPDGRADFLVDGAALYLRLDSPVTDGEVQRHNLTDGRAGWQIIAGPDSRFSGTVTLAGELLVLSGVCPSLSDAEILSVDRATGRIRWEHAGHPVGAVAGLNLIVVEVRRGEQRCGEPPLDPVEVSQGVPAFAPAAVEVVDAATGATRWSFMPAPGTQVWYRADQAGAIRRIVTADSSGAAQARDAATGRVTATARLPGAGQPARPAAGGATAGGAGIVRDLLVIARDESTALTLTAYSPDSLTRLWSTPVATHPAVEVDLLQWYTSCDRYLCVQTSRELVAVNPANGSTGWRLPWVRLVASGARWVLIAPAGGTDEGPLLVDARTGWPGAALEGNELRGRRVDAPGVVVLGSAGPGYTTFTMLDLSSGERHVLGRARGRYDRCEATSRYLACLAGTRTVRVWRLVGDSLSS